MKDADVEKEADTNTDDEEDDANDVNYKAIQEGLSRAICNELSF